MRDRVITLLITQLLTIGISGSPAAQVRPVTDEELRDPAPADWPMIRRTYDARSYSPLDQINRANVGGPEMKAKYQELLAQIK